MLYLQEQSLFVATWDIETQFLQVLRDPGASLVLVARIRLPMPRPCPTLSTTQHLIPLRKPLLAG
jgi:hypothetical protein